MVIYCLNYHVHMHYVTLHTHTVFVVFLPVGPELASCVLDFRCPFLCPDLHIMKALGTLRPRTFRRQDISAPNYGAELSGHFGTDLYETLWPHCIRSEFEERYTNFAFLTLEYTSNFVYRPLLAITHMLYLAFNSLPLYLHRAND